MRLQKPIDDIPLSWLDTHFVTHNILRQHGVEWLSEALKWIQHPSPETPNLLMSPVSHARRALHGQGYLLYGHWDHMRIPSHTAQLSWLVDTQNQLGFWIPQGFESGMVDTSMLDYTIAATLSFIRAGHTSTRGQYASVVARAIRWLEREQPSSNNMTIYGLMCVLAENYQMKLPKPLFEIPPRFKLKTFDHLRQWALIKGNAPIYPWDYSIRFQHDEIGEHGMNHGVQMAWMSVSAPKPLSR